MSITTPSGSLLALSPTKINIMADWEGDSKRILEKDEGPTQGHQKRHLLVE